MSSEFIYDSAHGRVVGRHFAAEPPRKNSGERYPGRENKVNAPWSPSAGVVGYRAGAPVTGTRRRCVAPAAC